MINAGVAAKAVSYFGRMWIVVEIHVRDPGAAGPQMIITDELVSAVASPRLELIAAFSLRSSAYCYLTFSDDTSLRWLKLAHDGLEREIKIFNRLEGGVCTTCAPEDQRKSDDNQREHAELNVLRCPRR